MNRVADFPYLPKDFIETAEGLIFAVVSYHPQDGKVGCFLRYVFDNGQWQKVDTDAANRLLTRHYPDYRYTSAQFEAHFHAVPIDRIIKHHQPEQRLAFLLSQQPADALETKLHHLVHLFQSQGLDINTLGVTGSMLIGRQREGSDIDLVVYGHQAFHQARASVANLLATQQISALDFMMMQDNFERRNGSLSFDDFAWHEQRKHNKAVIDGSKFDIGMVCLPDEVENDHRQYRKCGMKVFKAIIAEDALAFDFPARYRVDNPLTPEIVCFTHTYVGQAKVGERVEISGAIECDSSGVCRIIIGSSREATGEYIKVCK